MTGSGRRTGVLGVKRIFVVVGSSPTCASPRTKGPTWRRRFSNDENLTRQARNSGLQGAWLLLVCLVWPRVGTDLAGLASAPRGAKWRSLASQVLWYPAPLAPSTLAGPMSRVPGHHQGTGRATWIPGHHGDSQSVRLPGYQRTRPPGLSAQMTTTARIVSKSCARTRSECPEMVFLDLTS